MAHLFDGEPDGRQCDETADFSRFRPRYRPLTDAQKALHDAIKAKASELEALFLKVKPGPYGEHAMIALEASVMWAIKDLTL